MKQIFKVGHIVQDGTFVSSIDKIEGDMVLLSKNYVTKLEKVAPVVIRGGKDSGIILDNIVPIRASIIASGQAAPIRRPKSYIECDIEGETIVSIIERNGFRFIHELQDWIAQNAPDYFLRIRV